MRRNLPSTAALAAFEATARLHSFTDAAAELGLTQGAVSRQVQGLEAHVGARLFLRQSRGLALTDEGAQFLVEARACLERLEGAVLNLKARGAAGGVLSIGLLPTFGARWLMPRVPAFAQRHPLVALNFSTRVKPFDFEADAMDAAIWVGEGGWSGVSAHPLVGEELVAVGPTDSAPVPLRVPRPRVPADLGHLPRLQLATRPDAWAEWFTGSGVPVPPDHGKGPRFEQFGLAIQGVLAGLGYAVVPRFLIEHELASGLVEVLFDVAVRSRKRYWFAYPARSAHLSALRAFRDWIVEVATQEGEMALPARPRV